MANLRSCDNGGGVVYLHTDFTTSTSNYTGPTGTNGITHDGTDIYLASWFAKNIYQMVGETSSINSTVSISGYRPRGMTIDHNGDVVVVDNTNGDLMRRFVGFSNTLSKMITVPTGGSPWGCTYADGAYVYADDGTATIYELVGDMTSSVNRSFATGFGVSQCGLTGLDGDIYFSESANDLIYQQDGFSASNVTSIASPSTLPSDITFDDYSGRTEGGGGAVADAMFFGVNA
jgi:hypothetical protein